MNQRTSPVSSLNNSFLILAVAVLGILTTAIILLLYYVFVMQCRLNRQRLSFLWRFSGSVSRRRPDHFIVYSPDINQRGLSESVIRAIPIIQFEKIGSGEDGEERNASECAVCLNVFQLGEKLRLLPSCTHSFHIDCIDIWLQSNANCPLCRSSISIPISRGSGNFPNQDPSQISIDSNGDVIIDMGVEGTEDRAPGSQDSGVPMEIPIQSAGDQRSSCPPRKVERRILPKKQRRLQNVSSFGAECVDASCKDDDSFCVQPIRRSFSLDSSADWQFHFALQEIRESYPSVCEMDAEEGECRVRRSFFSFGHGRRSKIAVIPVQPEQ